MRNMFKISAVAAFFFVIGATALAQINDQTVSYLQQQDQSNPWVLMALKSSGADVNIDRNTAMNTDTALEVSKSILMISAADKNPFEFRGNNYVSKLDDFRGENQIGNADQLNDDIWGIIAYTSAAIESEDPRVQQSASVLLNNQSSEGGWGYAPQAEIDSNDTAMAIVALRHAGLPASHEAIQNALAYLRDVQNSDGGFGVNASLKSDAASTAWVMSAVQAADIDPRDWEVNGNTPSSYLETLRTREGSYKWKPTSERGDPTTTSFAAIALNGSGYPVTRFVPADHVSNPRLTTKNASAQTEGKDQQQNQPADQSGARQQKPLVDFRFEGSVGRFCAGETRAKTPFEVVKNASHQCGFEYRVKNTDRGVYIPQIGFDAEEGEQGWLYFVNWKDPEVGATEFELSAGDYVNWYYGKYDDEPLKIEVINSGAQKGMFHAMVEVMAYNGENWRKVEGTNVKMGSFEQQTDANGRATIEAPMGVYTIFAQKENFVRSNRLKVGEKGESTSKSVPLKTEVIQPEQSGSSAGGSGQASGPAVAFSMDVTGQGDALDFGRMMPGQARSRSVTLQNDGRAGLSFHAGVSGDQLYQERLNLNEVLWREFRQSIAPDAREHVQVELNLPDDFTQTGDKSGDLIFWAQPS